MKYCCNCDSNQLQFFWFAYRWQIIKMFTPLTLPSSAHGTFTWNDTTNMCLCNISFESHRNIHQNCNKISWGKRLFGYISPNSTKLEQNLSVKWDHIGTMFFNNTLNILVTNYRGFSFHVSSSKARKAVAGWEKRGRKYTLVLAFDTK